MIRPFKNILFFICIGVLLFHFSVIALSLLPDNPIKHQYKYETNSYINPLFSQCWNLFAPEPINTNMTVLVQFKIYNKDSIVTTKWLDLMEPLILQKRKSFWSPVQRISKFITSSLQNITEHSKIMIDQIKKDTTLTNDSLATQIAYENSFSSCYGHKSILQYSNYVFYKMNYQGKIDSVLVRYEIFNSKFPRFSKRKENFFDIKHYEFTKSVSKFNRLSSW